MWNNSGDSENVCFVPDLRENAFRFSPFSTLLATVLLHVAFTIVFFLFLQDFYEALLNFITGFFCIY
jgi:hypothetical protein